MGSRKLILLPQVLSTHTFDGASHVIPRDASPCLAKPSQLSNTLAGIAWSGHARPDLAKHPVSLCPAQSCHPQRYPRGFCLVW
jgi:hypothetical protein